MHTSYNIMCINWNTSITVFNSLVNWNGEMKYFNMIIKKVPPMNAQAWKNLRVIKYITVTVFAEVIWIRIHLKETNLNKTPLVWTSNYCWVKTKNERNKPESKVLQLGFAKEFHLMPTCTENLRQRLPLLYCSVYLL